MRRNVREAIPKKHWPTHGPLPGGFAKAVCDPRKAYSWSPRTDRHSACTSTEASSPSTECCPPHMQAGRMTWRELPQRSSARCNAHARSLHVAMWSTLTSTASLTCASVWHPSLAGGWNCGVHAASSRPFAGHLPSTLPTRKRENSSSVMHWSVVTELEVVERPFWTSQRRNPVRMGSDTVLSDTRDRPPSSKGMGT